MYYLRTGHLSSKYMPFFVEVQAIKFKVHAIYNGSTGHSLLKYRPFIIEVHVPFIIEVQAVFLIVLRTIHFEVHVIYYRSKGLFIIEVQTI